MPLIKSAKKAFRQNITKKSKNDHFRNLYREARIAFSAAIKESDVKAAQAIFQNTKSEDGKTTKA
jgi:ribosomal protein S20